MNIAVYCVPRSRGMRVEMPSQMISCFSLLQIRGPTHLYRKLEGIDKDFSETGSFTDTAGSLVLLGEVRLESPVMLALRLP